MRLALASFLLFAVIITGVAQSGRYDIQFEIHGLKDTVGYLGYYSGENNYIKDTAKIDNKGKFNFKGKKPLEHGLYVFVLGTTKIFEFVVGINQNFRLETSTEDYVKNMKVKDDIDNRLFFENIIFNTAHYKEAEPFRKIVQDSTLSEDKKIDARQSYAKIYEKVLAHQDEIIEKHPGTTTAKFLKAIKVVKIPDPPKKPDGSIDSTFQLRWYREHFFDNIDLGDEVFLHLPNSIYSEKVKEYLDRFYPPQKDSINQAIDKLATKARKNQETYKYLISICMSRYQTPEIMGLDEVFVYLYDNYFATGEMDFWANAKLKQNLKDYADRIRLSMLGKQGPDLIMNDTNDKLQALYNVKSKYTIVFFFDPDCGHCRQETPKLVEFYNKDRAKYNLDVFAVSVDSSMTKLKTFIKEFKTPWTNVNFYYSAVGHYQQLYDALTTPTLYVLDEKKKIIGKKIPVEKLGEFITNYEKFQKKKRGT